MVTFYLLILLFNKCINKYLYLKIYNNGQQYIKNILLLLINILFFVIISIINNVIFSV